MPLDQGNYDGLISFGVFATFAVVASILFVAVWTLAATTMRAFLNPSSLGEIITPIATTWILLALFLLTGGFRYPPPPPTIQSASPMSASFSPSISHVERKTRMKSPPA